MERKVAVRFDARSLHDRLRKAAGRALLTLAD